MRRLLVLGALVAGMAGAIAGCGTILGASEEDEPVPVDDGGGADASTLDAADPDSAVPDDAAGSDDSDGRTDGKIDADIDAGPFLRVFISQGERTGASLGSDIKTYCQGLANGANLGGTWIPWLSDSARNANAELKGNGPWKTLDNAVVAKDKATLLSGTLSHAIDRDQMNLPRSGNVWTGTGPSGGVIAANHCNDWTGNAGAKGRMGDSTATNAAWTDAVTPANCTVPGRVYCFEIP